jgi:hypothetical protein
VSDNRWFSVLFIFAAGAAAMSYPAQALPAESDGSLLNDRFTVSLGTFLLSTKTEVELNGSAGSAGTVVDLNKDLGFRDADRFRVDADWRFAKRHKVRALYFSTNQSSTRTLDRDLTVGDTVYPIDVEVTAKVSTSVMELAYEYIFAQGATYEVAGSAGIHSLKFDFTLNGTGSVNGQPGQFRSESAAATAPLPVVGLRGLWEFAPQWYVDGLAQYFAVKFDQYDGNLTDLRIGVTRMFGRRFGLGAGFNDFTTHLGIDKKRFNGDLRWRYSGAQLFVTASF